MSSELKSAIQKGDLAQVKSILKGGVNIDLNVEFDETYFYFALENENFEIADHLLKEKVDSIKSDLLKALCLRAGIENNRFRWVDFFVEKGVDLNQQHPLVGPYLSLALQAENFKMADYLIAKGANVLYNIIFGDTYLHQAARRGRTKCVEYLLAKGFDLEDQNSTQRTCLDEAIFNRKSSTMRFLIKKGANIHRYHEYDFSFFAGVFAQNKNNFSFIDTLFELGTTADSLNKLAPMMLVHSFKMFAIQEISEEVFARLLLKLVGYGVDLNAFSLERAHENANFDINRYATHPISSETKMLVGLGAAKENFFPLKIEYSSELKKCFNGQVKEEHIPAALRTVALYSHYDQHEVYRQQRADYLKSISTLDPDTYYKLVLLYIYFPQRLVMHALEKWKDSGNNFSENLKEVWKAGTVFYWNTTAKTTNTAEEKGEPLFRLLRWLPTELIESIIRAANSLESVERALAQLPRISSNALKNTKSRNAFRETMYADNYEGIANFSL